MAVHKSRRSILSLKSWLFTPATKADRSGRAAEVHADALIIDLEDAVAFSDKQKARPARVFSCTGLHNSAEVRFPCVHQHGAGAARPGWKRNRDHRPHRIGKRS